MDQILLGFLIGAAFSFIIAALYYMRSVNTIRKHYADLYKSEERKDQRERWEETEKHLEHVKMLRLTNEALEKSNKKYKQMFDNMNKQTSACTIEQARENLEGIIKGIDRLHIHDGWWADATGLNLGWRVKGKLHQLIERIYFSNYQEKEND